MPFTLTPAGKKAREISEITGLARRQALKLAKGEAAPTEPVRRLIALEDWCRRSGHDFKRIVQESSLVEG